MPEYKCKRTKNDVIKHIECGGGVYIDGTGKLKVEYGNRTEWFKGYTGTCSKCRKSGRFVMEKPYRTIKKKEDEQVYNLLSFQYKPLEKELLKWFKKNNKKDLKKKYQQASHAKKIAMLDKYAKLLKL